MTSKTAKVKAIRRKLDLPEMSEAEVSALPEPLDGKLSSRLFFRENFPALFEKALGGDKAAQSWAEFIMQSHGELRLGRDVCGLCNSIFAESEDVGATMITVREGEANNDKCEFQHVNFCSKCADEAGFTDKVVTVSGGIGEYIPSPPWRTH